MKRLSELTFPEMVQTLHNNYQLYDIAADAFVENQSDVVEEEMHDFEDACDWMEIGADAYIPAISVCQEQYHHFINGVMHSMLTYGFLGSHEDLIRRLWSKVDRFYLVLTGHETMSETRWNHFEKWFDDSIEIIADAAAQWLHSELDYDADTLADFLMTEIACEQMSELNDIVVDDSFTAYRCMA